MIVHEAGDACFFVVFIDSYWNNLSNIAQAE